MPEARSRCILGLLTSEQRQGSDRALTEAAFSGSSWTIVQVALNKGAAALAALFLGYLLTAEQFGVAWFATSVGQALLILPVVAVIDILLAHPRSFPVLARPASSLARRAGLVQSLVGLAAGGVLSWVYPSKPGLFLAMAVVSMRPFVDSMAIVPMSGMRIGLRYGTLAKVDCAVAFCASVTSVAMAWLGAGATSIVLPPIAAIAVRGIVYGRIAPLPSRFVDRARVASVLRHRFLVAAVGSYLASLVFMLEMVTLGLSVTTRSLGLFAFAFGLATQVNGAISFQAAGALQPIISRLADDADRQASAALRAIRLLVAVVVPILLVQCAVGGPIIRTAWQGKWNDAVPLFEALSVVHAAYVCQWPSAFILKAQGRFRGYLQVQVLNIAVAVPAFFAAIFWLQEPLRGMSLRLGLAVAPDASAPFAVILVSFVLVCCFSPLMLWLVGRPTRVPLGAVLDAVWRPWIVALPLAVLVGILARIVERLPGSAVVVVGALFGLAAVGCLLGVACSVCTRRSIRMDARRGFDALAAAVRRRIPEATS